MANLLPKNLKKDITNQQFERWHVLDYSHYHKGLSYWKCQCDCGTIKSVALSELTRGKSKSCGCLQKEQARLKYSTHGASKTKEYKCWSQIKQRCYNTKCRAYKDYGARGIKMSDAWLNSFETFLEDMGEIPTNKRHTIERRNVNGNYEKSNCYWADYNTQARNKRGSRFITINGETLILADWCKRLNISRNTVDAKARLRKLSTDEYIINLVGTTNS